MPPHPAWKHRLNAELLRVAWPIAISMLSHGTMSLVDTVFVARLGAPTLAAVGLGGVLSFFLICFPFGLLRSVKVAVSQAAGAGRHDSVTALVGGGLWLALVLGAGSAVIGWLLAPAITAAALTAPAAELGTVYLQIRVLGAPVFLVHVALAEARYGLGQSRLPMVAVVAGNVLNVLLTGWFVIGLGWGVAGAASATVIGSLLVASILLAGQLPRGLGLNRVRRTELARLWNLGIPLGLQFAVESGAFVLLVAIIAHFGDVQLAAHEVVLQLCHFVFLPTMAIGDAGSVLVGQAVGANQDDLVRRVSRRTWIVALGYALSCSLVFVALPGPLARMFTDEPGLRDVIVRLLRCAAVFQIFHAANIIARSTLRGTGDVTYPAIVNVALAWVVTPPLAWWLGGVLELGALGGWIGLACEVAAGAALLWWRLERGGWQLAAARSRAAIAGLPPPARCSDALAVE